MNWISILPIGYLWYLLFDSARLEWSTNPQYSYGWIVPILCAGLIVRNWTQPYSALQSASWPVAQESEVSIGRNPSIVITSFFAFGLFLFLPARLIAATTPEWRPLQWLLALIAVGATLYMVRLLWGKQGLKEVAFPICFSLIAVPWPTSIEQVVIQSLTQANASVVVELMGFLGIPAVQHGNVIEVVTGMVGIDEACSGIRSFQSSLMISLFLGEFYRLRWNWRAFLLAAGIVLSFAFNICRTSFLTWIAAKKGVAAIGSYHDPAGLAILVACTMTLLLTGWYLARQSSTCSAPSLSPQPEPRPTFSADLSGFGVRISIMMLVWLFAVEIGTHLWFASRESNLVLGPDWVMNFPEKDVTFKAHTIGEKTYNLLRYDQGKEGEWQDTSGGYWCGFYFNWLPGRVAGYLAKRHTPEVCMSGAGQILKSGPDLFVVKVHDVALPIRQYLFESGGTSLHVFHCRWEAGVDQISAVQHESTRINLIRGIWAGRGNQGQKVFEFIVTGYNSPTDARAALLRQLESFVHIEPATARETTHAKKDRY